MQQLDFLNQIDPAPDTTIPVRVCRDGQRFVAEICGGWWRAAGATKQDAVKRAVENYERESKYPWF